MFSVCHLARVFVSKLREKLERYKDAGTTIKDEEEKCIRIAALCHDLGKIYHTLINIIMSYF